MSTNEQDAVEAAPLKIVEESFNRYRAYARLAKKRYHGSEILLLVLAAAIPASAAFTTDQRVPATLGALVVVLAGARSVYRWHEDWLRFTETCEQLKAAKQLYILRSSPFAGSDRDELLVRRVREIEDAETSSWLDLRKSASTGAAASNP